MSEDWLDGWKAIAKVLRVSVRTAQRYHAAGMPVANPGGMHVKALRCEITAWWENYVMEAKERSRVA